MLAQLFGKKTKQQGRVGIAVNPGKLSVVHLEKRNDAPYLLGCKAVDVENSKKSLEAKLVRLVHEMGLAGRQCSYVLGPDEYSLHLIEAPKVEPEELRAAVRWSVKDLLDMKIDDAAIDIFPVPDDAYRGRKMVYVVAAAKTRIRQIAEMVTNADLELAIIDIPELAMKNISNCFIDDSNGAAFMDLRLTGSTMNISHKGDLYLSRRINTQLAPDALQSPEWASLKDKLVLEIQRSLDYYESQMSKGQITRIVIAQRQQDTDAMCAALNDSLSAKVSALNLAHHIESELDLTPELQQLSAYAIGATLRGMQKREAQKPDPAPVDSQVPPAEEAA